MKITKEQIKQIVKEEIAALDEKWSWEKFKKDIGWTKGVSPAERDAWEAMAKEKIAAGAAKRKAREQEDAEYDAKRAARETAKEKAAAGKRADAAAAERRARKRDRADALEKARARAKDDSMHLLSRHEGQESDSPSLEEKIYKRLEKMIRGSK